jgi:hypothetical protein
MKRFFPVFWALALASGHAVDVHPSREVQPEKFREPGGKRFSIFAGDPNRIQKANEIKFEDFEAKLEVTPNPLSLESAKNSPGNRPMIKVVFSVKNTNPKKTYTLSFPDAQRYDIRVKDAAGNAVYTWSSDKEFVQSVGTILLNASDKISFTETIALGEFASPPAPGAYTVEAVLGNYPEITAKIPLTVNP